MTDRIIGIIQARTSSERLPGKVITQIRGVSMLEWICRRVASSGVDNWWVATTDRSGDAAVCQIAEQCGASVFRGSVDDVLSRFVSIIRNEQPETIVRLTADNPFVDAPLVDLAISQYQPGRGVVWTAPASQLPLGYSVEVVEAEQVVRASVDIRPEEPYHRSHVLTWIHRTRGSTPIQPPDDWPARRQWRWTVDTPEDWDMVEAAVELFGDSWPSIDYPAMVGLFDRSGHIPLINQHIEQRQPEER